MDNYYPRLRDLREDHDKTQKEVAEYLGTTQQVYSRYEKGENENGKIITNRICEIL